MSTRYGPVPGSTGRVRGLLVAVLALVLGCLGMLATQTAASAKPIDAITGVTIAGNDRPGVGSSVRVDATWSAPGARSGDTFTLKLPTSPKFDGIASTFDLKNSDDPSTSIGTCTVSSTEITCTFGAYADTHTGLSGTLFFWAVAKQESDQGTVEFVTENGVVFKVKVPGGSVGPKDNTPYKFPKTPFKDANVDHNNGEVDWAVYIPGAALHDAGGQPITLTDTFDARLTLRATPRVLVFTKQQWEGAVRPWGHGRYLNDNEYAYTPGATPNTFQLVVTAAAIDDNNLYVVEYQTTLPAAAKEGDVYTNVATGGSWSAPHDAVYHGAGGDGLGYAVRQIEVAKAVVGDNPAAGPFEFQVGCVDADGATVPGYPKSVEVAVDQPASIPGVEVGWTCTVNETDAAGGQVSYDGSNAVEVTVDSPAKIVLTATNTFVSGPTGGLTVSKVVAGDGAAKVPADTQYSVEYSYGEGDSAVTGVLALTTDTEGVLEGLPVGTVVTLNEVTPVDLDGVAWTGKSFVVDGETVGDEAEVTIGEETDVQVEITNTAEPVVEPPATCIPPGSTPDTDTPSDTPICEDEPVDCVTSDSSQGPSTCAPAAETAGPTPTPSAEGSNSPLAQTGATVALVTAIAVLLLGAGGVLLMVRRRARA